MRNIKLILSYDGTDFPGWQRQPRTADRPAGPRGGPRAADRRSSDDERQRPDRRRGPRAGAGRPFLHGVAALDRDFVQALNAMLPRDVRVLDARRDAPVVPRHARREVEAVSLRDRQRRRSPARSSSGTAGTSPSRSTSTRWTAPRDASWAATTSAASRPTGPTGPAASGRSSTSPSIARGDSVTIEVEADGFLYNMVRSIAGTLVLVGTGKRPEAWVGGGPGRREPGRGRADGAPQGLFLVRGPLWLSRQSRG